MANEPNIVLTAATWARLQRVLDYVEGLMRANIPNGTNTPWGPVFAVPPRQKQPVIGSEPGGSIDLLQAGTNVVSATPFINIPTTRGSSNIIEFAAATVSGTQGANLQFKSGAGTRQVLSFDGTNVVWDFVRFHT